VVRLTDRGWAAVEVIDQAMARLERQWAQALGDDAYRTLAHSLQQLQDVLDAQLTTRR
jgi:hypothetical protein